MKILEVIDTNVYIYHKVGDSYKSDGTYEGFYFISVSYASPLITIGGNSLFHGSFPWKVRQIWERRTSSILCMSNIKIFHIFYFKNVQYPNSVDMKSGWQNKR